jgi:hypothetical protein
MPFEETESKRRAFPWCAATTGFFFTLVIIFVIHEYSEYYEEHSEVVKYSLVRLEKICNDRHLVEEGHWHTDCHDASHNVKMDPATYAKKKLFVNWGLGSFVEWGIKLFPPAMILSVILAVLFLKNPVEWFLNKIEYTWGKPLFPN